MITYLTLLKEKPVSSYVNKIEEENKDELEEYIKTVSEISQYGVYMDITPIEVKDKGFNVMRVFIPELIQMSFLESPLFKASTSVRIRRNKK